LTVDRSHALDHVVLVLFENRSLDNLLGHLYGPEDGKTFEGVIGKGLSNPIPEWAEHGAERKTVPYTVGTDMDAPNPDSGEEYFHTNTQLFNVLDEHNRFKLAEQVTAPWNAPAPGAVPTMDGFVTDYISTFTAEMGRQPTYEEYAQIMTGYTPEQVPVLNGLAKGFGVFDHWFCEVPSQTLMNRSFWTAATSSGFVINKPASNFVQHNSAETLFERLEAHGRTWKVYVQEPMSFSAAALIHMSRLKDRLATHFVPFSEFEHDVAAGTLPDFSMIEPNLIMGHSDYHPAVSRALGPGVELPSTRRRRSWEARRSWPASIPRSARPLPRRAPTRTTRCSSSAGTSQAVPTTMCPQGPCRHRTPAHPRGSWTSHSTAPATACRRSSCPRGWMRGS
jgi:phospholipase C